MAMVMMKDNYVGSKKVYEMLSLAAKLEKQPSTDEVCHLCWQPITNGKCNDCGEVDLKNDVFLALDGYELQF